MLADSTAWLFVARGIQGLATGLALGAASAALLDLHPRRDPARSASTNGVVSAGGMGLGIGISAAARRARPRAPRAARTSSCSPYSRSPSTARCGCPSPSRRPGRVKLTPQRPSVPPAVRRPFFLAALAVISSWSIGGLFISLGPALGATLLHTDNHLVTGARRRSRWPARAPPRSSRSAAPRRGPAPPLGSLALATGMVAIVIAAATETTALYWFGAADRRRGLRRRVPRRPARPVGRDPATAPRRGHVRLLRRRLPGDLAARDPRRRARDAARAGDRRSRSSARSWPPSRSPWPSRPTAPAPPPRGWRSRRPDARPRQGSDPISRNRTPRSDRDRAGPPQVGRIVTDRVELARARRLRTGRRTRSMTCRRRSSRPRRAAA